MPSTQTSFPALVVASAARFKTIGNGGHVQTGTDIRPYSDTGLSSALTYEMEFYDGTNGIWIGWVLISSLADAVTIYLGYGDAALNTDGSSTSTWPSQYKSVYHLSNGSSLSVNDSTSNALNGTNHSSGATTGKIDGGASFNGSSQYIDLGDPSSVDFGTGDYCLQAWVYDTNVGTTGQILSKDGDVGGRQFEFSIGAAGSGQVRSVIFGDDTNYAIYDSPSIVSANTWTKLDIVRSGNSAGALHCYKNGSSQTFSFVSNADFPKTMQATSTNLNIGRRVYSGFEGYFPGNLDEIRISNTAPSANWITTEYNNQSAPNTFWTMGSEVPVGSSNKPRRFMNSYRQWRAA